MFAGEFRNYSGNVSHNTSEYFAFPDPRSSLWRRADHRIVELRHECALIWSGVVSERFRLFDQDLFRVGAKYFQGLFDEVLQRHGPWFLFSIKKVGLDPRRSDFQNAD
jgi:hypothetical protein